DDIFDSSNFFVDHSNLVLARYHAAHGSLDSSFGQGGLVADNPPNGTETAQAVAFQPWGSGIVVAGGGVKPRNSSPCRGLELSQYDQKGSLDPSFGTDGKVVPRFTGRFDAVATAVATLPDGQIVVAGTTGYLGSETSFGVGIRFALTEYNPDGTLDTAF